MPAQHYPYISLTANDIAPFVDAVAVTPSDATDLAFITRGLYVGVTGDVAVALVSGNITFKAVPAGTILPVKTGRVLATGTTATNLLALY